ncbi:MULTISPECIES: hypothetical protein [unclassified Streptomyces]|uniref:hypothetical protein n=1 Tax=unclassified Streptomyces TaxID=2593676 RepID=UPI003824D882
MDWLAPVNTLIGAVIGVGSTLLADRFRWRRERQAQDRDSRRQAYAAFMGALSDVYSRLHETARATRPPEETSTAAHEIFTAAQLYPLRYELALIAPWDVMDPTNEAFWRARDLRDTVASGAGPDTPEFRTHVGAYLKATEKAQTAMRRDLGTPWPERDEG